MVNGLILISAPMYRKEDIKNPMFERAMDGFRSAVAVKSKGLLKSKAFNNEMEKIVLDGENYEYLLRLSKSTVIIYGELDTIIASFNVYGQVDILTGGGPMKSTSVLMMFIRGYVNDQPGLAAAMSIILGLIIVVIGVIQNIISSRGSKGDESYGSKKGRTAKKAN